MDEYIKREDVLRSHEEEQRRPGQYRFETLIKSVPSANVAPVRHGRWLSWDALHGWNTPAKNVLGVFCSECIRQSDSKTDFCPNSGAKMDLEEPNGAE